MNPLPVLLEPEVLAVQIEEIMKKIKIKFVDFWPGFELIEFRIFILLREKYEVVLDENPDYIIYSVYGYEYLEYDCIRIFYTGEQVFPDFDICDYAIGFDHLAFEDRYLRYPIYLLNENYDDLNSIFAKFNSPDNLNLDHLFKRDFCSILVSNEFALTKRIDFFRELSLYKNVDSGGRTLNNIGFVVKDKLEFISKYKFNIAFENCIYKGYTTEKIVDAFKAHTVPIYFGNPLIASEFNPESFINFSDFQSTEDLVKYIIKVDSDENLYLKILKSKKILNSSDIFRENHLKEFIYNIFDQDINYALRRPTSQRSIRKKHLLIIEKKTNKLLKLIPTSIKNYIRGRLFMR